MDKEHRFLKHLADFDFVSEQEWLRRATRLDSVEVLMGTSERTLGQCQIRYRKGKLIQPDGSRGQLREMTLSIALYHRDRVADQIRQDAETL